MSLPTLVESFTGSVYYFHNKLTCFLQGDSGRDGIPGQPVSAKSGTKNTDTYEQRCPLVDKKILWWKFAT